ncbi:MAG TPA: hypothetical protein VMH27_20270 [Puia sp.]|nr:hypothetical protein [Puia sp.]
MGVNTTIVVTKPLGNRKPDMLDILKALSLPVVVDEQDLDFDYVLGHEDLVAAVFEDKVIFIDRCENMDTARIPAFTTAYPAEVLRVVNSDTTDSGGFLFWRDGKLVREVTFGADWMLDDLKAAGITDPKILDLHRSKNTGDPLDFEKASHFAMDVLANYALDFYAFDQLPWTSFRAP